MARIRAARRVIDPVFLDTPLYRCEALEPGLGCAVSIKLETANPVRSFKARGTEVIPSLLAGHGSRAVVCASAGNLGQALAWSGRSRGLEVTVVASALRLRPSLIASARWTPGWSSWTASPADVPSRPSWPTSC
jgi:threonine dehydratase